MKLKIRIKDKKTKAIRPAEKFELNIKLGVLSALKSKKYETERPKYFEEAYKMIFNKNFDIKNFFYGNKSSPNQKLNFCEMRSAADWIFFKTYKLTKKSKIILVKEVEVNQLLK